MKTIWLVVVILLAGARAGYGAAGANPNVQVVTNAAGRAYVSGELLVKFRGGTKGNAARLAAGKFNHTIQRSFEHIGWQHIKLPPGVTVEEALARYAADPAVLAVEPNGVLYQEPDPIPEKSFSGVPKNNLKNLTPQFPDDPLLPQQWGLTNIYAHLAWGITNGSTNVVVAVIDTGINYLHEDIAANMWRNPGEIPGNGIDDDGNGVVDDMFGVRVSVFEGIGNDPMDQPSSYHGTACASIIGGVGNNGLGMAGVNWRVQLMAVRYLDGEGRGYTSEQVAAQNYVLGMKLRGVNVRVVSMSYGHTDWFLQSIKDGVDALGAAGVVVVACAQNYATDNDVTGVYPASYPSTNLIAVAASTPSDRLAGFSNWGRTSVDLAAPGSGGIYTATGPGSADYRTNFNGTSASAPFVSGAVALLAATFPNATVAELKAAILNTVDIIEPFQGMMVTGGRLNVAKALLYLSTNQPPVMVHSAQTATVLPGSSVRFSASCGGTPPLSYQWYQGATALAGATNASFTIGSVMTPQSGFLVVVTNLFGSVSSAPVAVSLLPAPVGVATWGANQYGQGDVPSDLTNLVAIAGGRWHTLALRSDGTVKAWGWNYYRETAVPAGLAGVKSISASTYASLALSSNGTISAWGNSLFGETNVPAGLTDAAAITSGQFHHLALKSNGTVVAWGFNTYGQCNVPGGLSDVAAISAGVRHSMALQSNGTVVAWGENTSGECNVPAGLSGVRAIVAGASCSFALKNDGTVVAWGSNVYGQQNVPPGLSNVVAIAGYAHGLALKQDGTVVAWGAGMTNSASGLDWGQAIVPPGLTNVVSIASIGRHSLALVSVPALPVLAISRQGANTILSWPASAADWQLLAATNLVSPVGWQPWPGPRTTNQATISTSVSATGPSRFFQLRSP